MKAAKAEAVKLLVRASQLQRIVTGAAAGYRLFFSWILRNIQRLGDGADGSRPGIEEGVGPIDAPAVARFVTGQLMVDVLGRELQASPFARVFMNLRPRLHPEMPAMTR